MCTLVGNFVFLLGLWNKLEWLVGLMFLKEWLVFLPYMERNSTVRDLCDPNSTEIVVVCDQLYKRFFLNKGQGPRYIDNLDNLLL